MAIFAALGPVCLLLLRKTLKGHRCYHALMAIVVWFIFLGISWASGWAYGKMAGGSEKWTRIFDQGQHFVPIATCILVFLCLVFRPLLFRSLAVFALAYTVAIGGPYLWAEQYESPLARAREMIDAQPFYRFATDGEENFLLISRGPNGKFDAPDDALLAAVRANDMATSRTLGIDWDAVKDSVASSTASGGSGDLMFEGSVDIDFDAMQENMKAAQEKRDSEKDYMYKDPYGYGN